MWEAPKDDLTTFPRLWNVEGNMGTALTFSSLGPISYPLLGETRGLSPYFRALYCSVYVPNAKSNENTCPAPRTSGAPIMNSNIKFPPSAV